MLRSCELTVAPVSHGGTVREERRRGSPAVTHRQSRLDASVARPVTFVGTHAAKPLFPVRNPLGESLYLNDFPYTVVGVMTTKKQDSSYDGWDVNKVFIPFTAMRRDFPDKPPGTPTTFDHFLVTPKSVERHEACKHEIRAALGTLHSFDAGDKEACPIWDTVQ